MRTAQIRLATISVLAALLVSIAPTFGKPIIKFVAPSASQREDSPKPKSPTKSSEPTSSPTLQVVKTRPALATSNRPSASRANDPGRKTPLRRSLYRNTTLAKPVAEQNQAPAEPTLAISRAKPAIQVPDVTQARAAGRLIDTRSKPDEQDQSALRPSTLVPRTQHEKVNLSAFFKSPSNDQTAAAKTDTIQSKDAGPKDSLSSSNLSQDDPNVAVTPLKIKAPAKTTTPTRAVPPLPETSFKESDANGNKPRDSRKAIVQTRIKHVTVPHTIARSKPTPAKTTSPAAPEQAKSILQAIAESTSRQVEAPSEPTVAHAIGKAARIPETMNSSLVEKIIGRPSLIAFVSTQPTAPASSNDATEIGNGESAEEAEGYEDGLSAIERIRINVRPPVGEMPPDYASAKFAKSGEIVQRMGATRHWMMYEFNWEASALATRPVYFEDVNLERYGYSHGLLLEPFFSAGHFFLRVPFIPYMRGAFPPRKPIYTLGYGRPGSYFPYYLHRPPVSLRGFSQQAAWTMGLIAVLP